MNSILCMITVSFFVLLFVMAIACVGLFIGISGLLHTSSWKGKIGILLSIFVFIGCCTSAAIFLIRSNKVILQESLFQAALAGDAAKVSALIGKGADINAKQVYGSTLLVFSIETGDFRMFETLVEAGANVNDQCMDSYRHEKLTPLEMILVRSYYSWLKRKGFDYKAAVKLLLDHGAGFDFDAKDSMGKCCVQNAIEKNQIEILRLMLDNGADIHVQNENGGVLHWAIQRQASMPIVELLLSYHADVNAKNRYGNTPLHSAVIDGRKDVVLLLIKNGADISAKNKQGMTALEWAKKEQKVDGLMRRQETIDLLEQRD
jgi:ankyrin repeat protein